MDFEIQCIPVKCETRKLSEGGEELLDKVFGQPCTDMYDFEFSTPEECKDKGIQWECKSMKKKENITEDQRTKRLRAKWSMSVSVKEDESC